MTNMRIAYILFPVFFCISVVSCGDHPDGESEVSRSQDALGNYHFRFSVANNEGEQFREEGTDALGRVIGSYGLKHVDGTHRVVDYVADKGGFRATVRSNEPGLVSAEAADASIVKTDNHVPLSVAATSDDHSRRVFGRRIDLSASQVSYVDGNEGKSNNEKDESVRESRQNNFDDYRPLSPVAYYPSDTRSPLSPSISKPVDQARSPRVLTQNSEADSKPLDVYFPPIDPHTAVRRPAYYLPRDRSTEGNFFPTTTSRKPYIPPYGGFDDDDPIIPIDRRPEVPIHRDYGHDFSLSTPSSVSSYGARRFPNPISPDPRNFDLPRFPQTSSYPSQQSGIIPPVSYRPRDVSSDSFAPISPHNRDNSPDVLFKPPSYDGRHDVPNLVLRAVPIPNGVQAVRVDPTSGRVIERLVYPLFLRHDGHPEYDRNILLHNDDVSDDSAIRHDDPGYLDIPYLQRPYRGVRNHPDNSEDNNRYRNKSRSYNINEESLSEPSAADIDWIKRQLALVEGFDRNHFSDKNSQSGLSFQNSNFPRGNPFDDENPQLYEKRIPGSRIRSSDLLSYSSDEKSARSEKSNDELSPESSKTVSEKVPDEKNLKELQADSET